ncbi:putative Ig domain-containing protein, partial [Geobacter sp.]|uniref:putative Ig domain-containing protein n=1 Tax=Geobacter sp. TaxID=46610 RepID=UPI002635B833
MDFAQRFKVLLWALCLFVVAAFVPQANAANWTLTSGNSTVAFNDSGSAGKSPGVYSWIFDSVEHVSQQAFYYRIGTTSPELPVSGDALDSTAPFTVAATGQTASSVTLTFTEKAGRFTMAVTYELIGGTTGRSTLNKKVVITNLTAAPLDLHLFSYSDYDLKTGPDLFENTAIVNGKAYQSNFATASDTVGSGTTLVERATVPPSRYGIDNSQFLGNLANGATPYDLDNFAGPYTIPGGIFDNGDKQFALQWDLTVDPATPTSFTITDAFYPTKALYLSKSTPGTCVNYGQTFTNTYTFDNTRNTSSPVNNIQISEQLARDISLASATNGGTYDATTGTVNWNVPQLAAGAVQQTVQGTFTVNSAVDFTMASQLASDEAFPSSYSAKLTLCNHPPAITSSPVKSGTEGQPYSYQVTASDSDAGTTLTYSLDAAPTSMQIDPTTGLITWTPTSAQTGNNTVTVRVSDGSLSATQTYTLFIAYINAPPAFTSTPATTATVGQVYTYMAVAADPNKGDKVTYGLPTAPAGMTIDPNLGVITWTPDATQVGVNHVVVQATDSGYLYVTQAFDITVSSGVTNSPPTITSAPVASATDNVAYSYTVVATDPNNDSLTYSLAGAPAGMTISGNVISWPSPVAGSYSLTVTVNDGKGGTVSQNWLLTVTHVNRPPVINTTALPAGTDAASYSSQVDATDPDKDALSYSLLYQPVGLTISSTGLLSWASPVAGTYTFNVTVTDSNQASTTKSFTFTITKVTKTTPTITWATPAAITYGTTLSSTQLNASVSGGIAGSFTYSPA